MAKTSLVQRRRRHIAIRKKITGTAGRPRMVVYRSLGHIYAQLIDDATGTTLAQASSVEKTVRGSKKEAGKTPLSKLVGMEVAKRALAKNISTVVFDRNGYLYHGRVKALADGAREAGLKF